MNNRQESYSKMGLIAELFLQEYTRKERRKRRGGGDRGKDGGGETTRLENNKGD